MNLQLLSNIRNTLDLFDERFYDLKEALLDTIEDTSELEAKLESSISEVILVLSNAVTKKELKVSEQLKKSHKDNLLHIVCECANISVEELKTSGRTRKREYLLPKQVHMAFLHKTFGIGQAKASKIWERDHSTVDNSCKTVRNLYQTNNDFRIDYKSAIDHCLNFDKITGSKRTTEYLNG